MSGSRVIFLGAEAPRRGLVPAGLIHTSGERLVLDWLIHAYSKEYSF